MYKYFCGQSLNRDSVCTSSYVLNMDKVRKTSQGIFLENCCPISSKKKRAHFNKIIVSYHSFHLAAASHPKFVIVEHIRMVLQILIDQRPNDIWKMLSKRFHVDVLENYSGTLYSVAMCGVDFPIHRMHFRKRSM